MRISDNVLNALAACEYRGIGKAWINKNLHGGETTEQVVRLVSEKDCSIDVCGFERRKAAIKAEICALGDAIDGVTGIGDTDFPVMPSGVKEGDRPIALFYKGDISLIKAVRDNVAVIGLLTPSQQIEDEERKVVCQLVGQGKCIVSGLALGCDSIGHREALDCGGKTVAFLSSPLTEINPPSNRPLANEIVANGGLLVSEYFRRAHSRREFIGRYAERDRLQAMFAEAVVLAASYSQRDYGKDSGSRFAMGKAIEYGIPRYVIYDSARDTENPMFNLARESISNGAKIIRPDDEFELAYPRAQGSQLEFNI
jgi:DNA processing protein